MSARPARVEIFESQNTKRKRVPVAVFDILPNLGPVLVVAKHMKTNKHGDER